MKECLFKSGLEGPLLNAPPFSPCARTRTLPFCYAQMCAYSRGHIQLRSHSEVHKESLRICTVWPQLVPQFSETMPSKPPPTSVHLSLRAPSSSLHCQTLMSYFHCFTLSRGGPHLSDIFFLLCLSCRHELGPLYCFFISFPRGHGLYRDTVPLWGGFARKQAQCSPFSWSTEEVTSFTALSLSLSLSLSGLGNPSV